VNYELTESLQHPKTTDSPGTGSTDLNWWSGHSVLVILGTGCTCHDWSTCLAQISVQNQEQKKMEK